MAEPKTRLRAVKPGEKPPAKPISTVLEAAESGSRLDELVQMQLVIARTIDNPKTAPRDLAALVRRQMEISKEIEALRQSQAKKLKEERDARSVRDEAFNTEAI